MARIASNVLVSAITRLTQNLGGFATIERSGSQISGAIYVVLYRAASGDYCVYEPASQAAIPSDTENETTRFFSLKSKGLNRDSVRELMEKEAKFDPDFWVVEVEGVSQQQLNEIIPLI